MKARTHPIGRSTRATPVKLRHNLSEALRGFRATWHQPRKTKRHAKRIMLLVRKHPWLMDQIPWDVFDLAAKAAR